VKGGSYDRVYFLGIGGIGMSALARWFMKKGHWVGGYDRTPTSLTSELMAEGMHIHFEDDVERIPAEVKNARERTLVVFTPAIPKDHKEHAYLKQQGFAIHKRSEVLGFITQDHPTVAVAGTHGKTTTSSMIAHVLKSAGRDMVAFLGGITTNYESNLVMHGHVNPGTLVVAEADEFDRSFLRLYPQVEVITSADADHLDIYGNHESLITSFKDFIRQINPAGTLIIHESISERLDVRGEYTRRTYGINQGHFFASGITAVSGLFEFDLTTPEGRVEKIKLGVPGFHNVENATAAYAACREVGVNAADIVQALSSFRGVKRRFEFILRTPGTVFVDDYAHHPAEIEAFLKSMRALYPGRKLTAIFQPHLYTRTRDFAAGFSKSLSLADEVLLMDIYPAREEPIPGVSSDMLVSGITVPVIRCSKKDLMHKLEGMDLETLVTVGAGDIDTFVAPIRNLLERRHHVA
jgi:UDP-N-acetylmuramate--alanine ligase